MNLENLEQIVNGICAIMPSGIEAEISMDNDGTVYVKYDDECCDTYTQDEFGRLMKDGIQVLETPTIEQQSVLMEHKINEISDELIDKVGKKRTQDLEDAKLNFEPNNEKSFQNLKDKFNKHSGFERLKHTRKLRKRNQSNNAYVYGPFEDEIKNESKINEISDELADKVSNKRLTNFVNSKLKDKNTREAARKLRKNAELNAKRDERKEMDENKLLDMGRLEKIANSNCPIDIKQKAQSLLDSIGMGVYVKEDVDKFFKQIEKKETYNMSILKQLTEQVNQILNELNDETVWSAYNKRWKNTTDAVDRTAKAKQRLNKVIKDKNLDDIEDAEKEYDDAVGEHQKAKNKLSRNIDLTLDREIRRNKQKNEEFEDTMSMLTDINDLDFPQELADTVDTTEDGEVVTLGTVLDAVNNVKDELNAKVDSLELKVDDIVNDSQVDDVEFMDALDDTTDALEDQIEDVQDDVDDVEEDVEDLDEPKETEVPEEDNEEPEEKEETEEEEEEEEELEESFRKYLRKGKYVEDLNDVKRDIDKAVQQGKDVEEIKNEIVLGSEDEKEEEEAKDYAISKLKESLLNTKQTSKLKDLNA